MDDKTTQDYQNTTTSLTTAQALLVKKLNHIQNSCPNGTHTLQRPLEQFSLQSPPITLAGIFKKLTITYPEKA